jgi:hypothetical protein
MPKYDAHVLPAPISSFQVSGQGKAMGRRRIKRISLSALHLSQCRLKWRTAFG